MNKKTGNLLILLSAIALCALNVNATIIVSGDVSLVSPLSPSFIKFNPGNQQLFTNILDTSTNVAILDQSGSNVYATKINSFYSSLDNVNSTLISTINASLLGIAPILVIPLPDNAFSNDELTVMNSYIGNGGSIFFLGDGYTFSPNNAIIDQALIGIGSSMSITNDSLDRGVQVATGAQISADPLTTDVKSITYGFVSAVQGGIPILSSANGTSFFAYENVTSVPEPPMTFLMLASILGFIGLIKRKNH